VLQRKGQLDAAIGEYRAALRLQAWPAAALYSLNLSAALLAKGELDGAIGSGRTAVRSQPQNADADFNLGLALKAKGEFDGGLAAFRYDVAQLLDRAGDLDGAIGEYRAMLASRPTHAST